MVDVMKKILFVVPISIIFIFIVYLYYSIASSEISTDGVNTNLNNGGGYQLNGVMFAVVVVLVLAVFVVGFIFVRHNTKSDRQLIPDDTHDIEAGVFDIPLMATVDEQRPSGLQNSAETCYMNSMIQALASSSVLIRAYEDLISEWHADTNCSKLQMFVDLLKSINKSGDDHNRLTRQNTQRLKELIHTVEWNRASQQDAFQMLSFFVNAIQKDLKEFLKKNQRSMPPKLRILHTFSYNYACNKVQDHLALAVPLCGSFRSGVHLTDLFDAFFKPSSIDDSEETTQMELFGNAPDVMIVHIQANEWSSEIGEYIKPKYYITYGDTLAYKFTIHMHVDATQSQEQEVIYELRAVVHHMGNVSGGHYITYRKSNKDWYLTNDEQVEKTQFNYDVVPYIMVYEKIKK